MRTHTIARVVLAVAAMLAAMTIGATGVASAAKVANPGVVQFIFEQGEIKIGSETSDAADPDDPIVANGVLSADSTLRFSGLSFPPIEVENTSGIGPNPIIVRVLPQQIPGQPSGVVGFGSLNPNTGIAQVQFRLAIKIDGFSDDCYIGSPGNPIVLNLTTETSGGQTGVRYNTGDGRLTIVDGVFSVPGASGCEYAFISVNGQINSELGLPSPSGNNYARLTARTSPIVIAGIRPSFTATPSSGVAPLPVAFDASATQSAAPVTQYRWDFTSDGVADVISASPTTSFTYTTPGTYQARLVVRDADGDESSTQRTIVVAIPRPDVSISLSHTPDPVATGETTTFTVGVRNDGTLSTSGPTTATFSLPAEWSLIGTPGGTGWICAPTGTASAECTYAGPLAIGEAAPALTVEASSSQSGTFTATATATTGGDENASNGTATDSVKVVQAGIDLLMRKTHDLDDGLFRGRRATYLLDVSNVGTQSTTGRTRIVDTLPDGVTFVAASGGSDWTCSYTAPTVRCFSDEVVAPGEALTTVRIVVSVDADAPDLVANVVTVTTPAESDTGNDTATDLGNVQGYSVDYGMDKTVVGTGGAPQGGQARFSLLVTNEGTGIGNSPVVVTDLLPEGLTYSGASGDGWTCASDDPSTVTCTHEGNVDAGGVLPAITVTADVAEDATGPVTNTAVVESDDDFSGDNDQDTAELEVRLPQADLSIAKSHEGATATVGDVVTFTIETGNDGAEPSLGLVTVADQLPAGLQALSISGTGWTCTLTPLGCTRSDRVASGAELPPITLTAKALTAGTLVNVATVANDRDVNPDNNRAEDPLLVLAAARPTSIEAYAVLLYVKGLTATSGILNGPEAKLTSLGEPVVNRELVFRTSAGKEICRARTGTSGVARCGTVLIPALEAILSPGYRVSFAGDREYRGSAASGVIIKVNTSLSL